MSADLCRQLGVVCRIISNDGSPESLYLLTAAKDLFSRQLPRMPRDYIARLVFDPNHFTILLRRVAAKSRDLKQTLFLPPFETRHLVGLAQGDEASLLAADVERRVSCILGANVFPGEQLLSQYDLIEGRVIGAIAVRAFTVENSPKVPPLPQDSPMVLQPDEEFGEIAFCAMEIDCQFVGFGRILMAALKTVLAGHPLPLSQLPDKPAGPAPVYPTLYGLRYLITYADNNAISFFEKSGFTRNITMRPALLEGRIKNYDGATPMQCTIEPNVNYMTQEADLRLVRAALLIRSGYRPRTYLAKMLPEKIIPPLKDPVRTMDDVLAQNMKVSHMAVGRFFIRDWRSLHEFRSVAASLPQSNLHVTLSLAFRRIVVYALMLSSVTDFWYPVPWSQCPTYYLRIPDPISLIEMLARCDAGYYRSLQMFVADVRRLVGNCHLFNEGPGGEENTGGKGLQDAGQGSRAETREPEQAVAVNDTTAMTEEDARTDAQEPEQFENNEVDDQAGVAKRAAMSALIQGSLKRRLSITELATRLGAVMIAMARQVVATLAPCPQTAFDPQHIPIHSCSQSVSFGQLDLSLGSILSRGLPDAVLGGAWQWCGPEHRDRLRKLCEYTQYLPDNGTVQEVETRFRAIQERQDQVSPWPGGLLTPDDEPVPPSPRLPIYSYTQAMEYGVPQIELGKPHPEGLSVELNFSSPHSQGLLTMMSTVLIRAFNELGPDLSHTYIENARLYLRQQKKSAEIAAMPENVQVSFEYQQPQLPPGLAFGVCAGDTVSRELGVGGLEPDIVKLENAARGMPGVSHLYFLGRRGNNLIHAPDINDQSRILAADRYSWDGRYQVSVICWRINE